MYLEDIDVFNLLPVLGLHELDPRIAVGVVAVDAHDAEILLGVGVCQNIIMVLFSTNDVSIRVRLILPLSPMQV